MSPESRAQAADGAGSSAEHSSAERSSTQFSSAESWEEAFRRAPQKGLLITAGAAAFGKQKLNARGTPDAAIRLGIKGGGCSGFSYVIQFEDGVPRERDYAYEVDNVRFVVDKKSFIYLTGSVFDYEKTLMFQGFKFRNPNEASSCGCGHSFTVR